MTTDEQRVLAECMRPRTRFEIGQTLGLTREAVTKEIRKLEKKGLIISRGFTAARKHMTLAAAIEVLFKEIARLSEEVETRFSNSS